MKLIYQYIRFFLYTAYHWNFRLAFFLLYHDIRGAIKYGTRRTFAPVPLRRLTVVNGDITKSSPYEAVSYYMLEKLLAAFRDRSDESSIVDLGCGKGRVLVTSAYFGFTEIKGIDFARELCEEAIRNMKMLQAAFPVIRWKVINANVIDYDIGAGDTVFFMFNPFDEDTLISFLDKLEMSYLQFPRKIYFLYASPQYAGELEKRGYKIIYRQSLMNLKGIILVKE